jgi:L-2,4-diaminobutyric acid acetyltransferase
MRRLAHDCPPLDLHTPYTYWVISQFFADSCFVLEADGQPAGFISSVGRAKTWFIWQVGILSQHRGRGNSGLLYDALMSWAVAAGLERVGLTIAPDNVASRASIEAYCTRHGFDLSRSGEISLTDLVDPSFHEQEVRYTISL